MLSRNMKSDINKAAHKMAMDVYEIFKAELEVELEKAMVNEDVTFQMIISRVLEKHGFECE